MITRTRLLMLALLLAIGVSMLAHPLWASTPAAPAAAPLGASVFIDADPGVDDSIAVGILLRSRLPIVGITTVAGNSTVDNATRNVLTILDVVQKRGTIPVTMGAAQPLVFPASRVGTFIHGLDGLQGYQRPQDLTSIPRDAPAAIAQAARTHPGMVLLALGPLTNVAQAVQRFPQDMANLTIVALGGAQKTGNRTPVAEANAYFDPQAFDVVLKARLHLTILTEDAFDQVTIDSVAVPQAMASSNDPLARFLAAPLAAYGRASTGGAGGPVDVPDAVAALYVLRPQLAQPQSGLVMISTDAGITRGETIIVTDPTAKIGFIATDAELSNIAIQSATNPNFDLNAAIGSILARQPDNAQVILTARERVNGGGWMDAVRGAYN